MSEPITCRLHFHKVDSIGLKILCSDSDPMDGSSPHDFEGSRIKLILLYRTMKVYTPRPDLCFTKQYEQLLLDKQQNGLLDKAKWVLLLAAALALIKWQDVIFYIENVESSAATSLYSYIICCTIIIINALMHLHYRSGRHLNTFQLNVHVAKFPSRKSTLTRDQA